MSDKHQQTVPMPTRERLFGFLVQYKREHDGNSPSKREIAEGCCVSTSTVNYHLTRLELDNRVRISGEWRSNIEIVGGTWNLADPHHKSDCCPPDERQTDDNPELDW